MKLGKPTSTVQKKRLILGFAFACIALTFLVFRLGWYQIIRREYFYNEALKQQTSDTTVSPDRGDIYDRNGNELAVSSVTYTVWAWPESVATGKTEAEKAERLEKTVQTLCTMLNLEEDSVRATLTADKSIIRVTKYVKREAAEQLRAEALPGISVAEDVTRTYPLGAFAAHVIGSTTDDNQGLSGLELWYNQSLTGKSGRQIINTDTAQRSLAVGKSKYYDAQDGLSIVTTLDEIIQLYTEQALEQAVANTEAKRAMGIVMNPTTGEVLAMSVYPDFDPNDPRTPLDEEEAAYVKTLSSDDQLTYWNKMWRNPLISDIYEPGSVFKLITASIALEEGVVTPDEKFHDSGSITVAGTDVVLHCWRTTPHGDETFTQAVQNSCNPIFVQMVQRIGKETFYDYLDLYNFTGRTGIDYPGEGYSLIYAEKTAGPVELATMSYGQGIAVTPISMLTAVSAIVNGGYLMEPHLVKEYRDSEGNVVETVEPTVVRQILSAETCEEMRKIMESVVTEGSGGVVKVSGYDIGGKSGTADKAENGTYQGNTYSSMLAVAPINDPQLAVLVIVDSPQGVKYGTQTAGPAVKSILEGSLRYLNIEPHYTEAERAAIGKKTTIVPDVTGKAFSEAIGILAGSELQYTGIQSVLEGDDFIIVDQYPKAGAEVEKNSEVYVYNK